MFTKDKITELFCMADDFCNFFVKTVVIIAKIILLRAHNRVFLYGSEN